MEVAEVTVQTRSVDPVVLWRVDLWSWSTCKVADAASQVKRSHTVSAQSPLIMEPARVSSNNITFCIAH